MSRLILIGLSGLAVVTGLASAKSLAQERLRSQLVAYRLRFPRRLDADSITAALTGICGMLLPWWRRWLASPFISLETHASGSGISHFLIAPEGWSQTAMNILEASLPSVRFESVEVPEISVRTAGEYRLSTANRVLLTNPQTISSRLLANLQPLSEGESIVVQWLLTPHNPVAPAKMPKRPAGSTGLPYPTIDSESIGARRKKIEKPLLLATGRIGVRAATGWSELKHLRQVEAPWHEARTPGVHFKRRLLRKVSVARSMRSRRVPLSEWPATLNVEELTGLISWPIDLLAMPGLALGGCRQIAPSPLIPTTGTVLADSTYPGNDRPIAVDVDARLRHLHCLAPTGAGKSNLLASIAVSDMEAGRGLMVLDPKADLIQTILERVPKHRRQDVIVFDPADSQCPVGLNPLRAAASGANAEVIVENLVGTFKSLYRSSWGPRLDDILRAALLTLTGVEGATLCEVPLLLSDPTYRRRIVGKLDDPIGLEGFWGWYEALSDAERQTVISPVLNKVRAFTMRPMIRSIIGQSQPRLQLADVMNSGKILLCSLATGVLGEEAAALLGSLMVAELWHATTARAALPASQRPPFMALLDEFQNFVSLPTPMASILAEARGLGLGVVLSHQHLDQLTDEVKQAALANCRSRVVFQLSAGDARVMTREMGEVLSADDLQGLGQYEVAAQLFAAGTTQVPATGKTRQLPDPFSDPAALRSASRAHYGTPKVEVEAAIRRRQTGGSAGGIGRRARSGGTL